MATNVTTRKTAITVPEELLDEVDRAAEARGESRSRFINRVLRAAVSARRDRDVTRRLDELFSNEELQREQLAGARDLDAVGTDWGEEGW